MENLPREVLEEILKGSTLFTRFTVATLSKNLYEKIRHIPLKWSYEIYPRIGNYFIIFRLSV